MNIPGVYRVGKNNEMITFGSFFEVINVFWAGHVKEKGSDRVTMTKITLLLGKFHLDQRSQTRGPRTSGKMKIF